MNTAVLPILQNPTVSARTSAATQRALQKRAETVVAPLYLSAELYIVLQQLIDVLLPQRAFGTNVDMAAAIDARLFEGTNAGWRFAELPADGEAYRQGLAALANVLEQTALKSFANMPLLARENFLRSVSKGEVDRLAKFPLSKWLQTVKTDAVKSWLSHPVTMQKIEFYGFADGAIGKSDGPTESEGWQDLTPDSTKPFERGADAA